MANRPDTPDKAEAALRKAGLVDRELKTLQDQVESLRRDQESFKAELASQRDVLGKVQRRSKILAAAAPLKQGFLLFFVGLLAAIFGGVTTSLAYRVVRPNQGPPSTLP